jgi:cytochrome c
MFAGLSIWLALSGSWTLAGCSRPAAKPNPAASRSPVAAAASPEPNAEQRAILATLPAPYSTADLYNGQAKFAVCKSCHTVGPGAGAAFGPDLWNVFGRKSGAAPGYAYSAGLRRLAVTWTAPALDAWIADPRAIVPGTRMAYAGMEDPRDRIDVVAYLKTVTTPSRARTPRGGDPRRSG